MSVQKITKSLVENLEATGKVYRITDTELKGFGVRVAAGGKAVYILRTKTSAGYVKDKDLGTVSELTITQARNAALELKAALQTAKRDGKQIEEVLSEEITFAEVSEQYLRAQCVKRGRLSYVLEEDRRSVWHQTEYVKFLCYREFISFIGNNKKLRDITSQDIERYYHHKLRNSAAGKSAGANRHITYISTVFKREIKKNTISFNPCAALEKNKEIVEREKLSTEQLSKFLRVITHHTNKPAAYAVKFSAVTGLRGAEVRSLCWEDSRKNNFVNFEDETAHFRDHKNAGKMGEMIIPLTSEALAVIEEVRDLNLPRSNPHIFAPKRSWTKNSIDYHAFQEAFKFAVDSIDISERFKKSITPHSLRHTFATNLINNTDIDNEEIAYLMLHKDTTMVKNVYGKNETGYNNRLREKLEKSKKGK